MLKKNIGHTGTDKKHFKLVYTNTMYTVYSITVHVCVIAGATKEWTVAVLYGCILLYSKFFWLPGTGKTGRENKGKVGVLTGRK